MNAVWRMGTQFAWVGTHVNIAGAEFQGEGKPSPYSPLICLGGSGGEGELLTDSVILPVCIRLL